MKLLIQPGDGVIPLIKAIDHAKSSIEILIFRFDQSDIERALTNAVNRGVAVHALIAHVNGSGGESLRRLEMRLLAAGVTVARTGDNLARYHAKFMIVDRRELYLMAFNLTHQDTERSRSFGIVTMNRSVVQEATKLFEADAKRQPYEPGLSRFVVSPANARKELSAFIKGAKKELLIYDPKVSDSEMIRLLEDRSKAGVDIKIIGRMTKRSQFPVHELTHIRLHARCMVRDGSLAFVGSQSLRQLELEGRREVGIIFRDPKVVSMLIKVFQEDWEREEQLKDRDETAAPAAKLAKKVAKAVTKDLPPVAPVLKVMIDDLKEDNSAVEINAEEVQETVKDAVKDAVRNVVEDAIERKAET